MEVGNRIIVDQDGEIISQSGDIRGAILPKKEITELHFIDLEYGAINYRTHQIVGIDIATKQPILEALEVVETEEQKHIRELEDALLLAADAEMGGIL